MLACPLTPGVLLGERARQECSFQPASVVFLLSFHQRTAQFSLAYLFFRCAFAPRAPEPSELAVRAVCQNVAIRGFQPSSVLCVTAEGHAIVGSAPAWQALLLLLAFPALLLGIGDVAVMGEGEVGAALALGIVGTPQMARIVRAGCLAEREMQYVESARSVGASSLSIMFSHILPNVRHLVAVQMVLFFVVAVLTEASLSFLGLGVQVPIPSLGSMLDDSRTHLTTAPWYALAPGVTLAMIVLALNLVADSLRDIFEARE